MATNTEYKGGTSLCTVLLVVFYNIKISPLN